MREMFGEGVARVQRKGGIDRARTIQEIDECRRQLPQIALIILRLLHYPRLTEFRLWNLWTDELVPGICTQVKG
jgi:hypothetical protein